MSPREEAAHQTCYALQDAMRQISGIAELLHLSNLMDPIEFPAAVAGAVQAIRGIAAGAVAESEEGPA